MSKGLPEGSFSDRLALWGVDRPPAHPAMLLDFIENQARSRSLPPMAQTLLELEERRVPLQLRLRHSLGLLPWPERTPLATRTVGMLTRPGYRIEKLVYEAWTGSPVTAHLYIPDILQQPNPAVLYACGHWMESGKLALPVQSFCAAAATQGIITLVYDPVGQGERLGNWRDHGNLDLLLLGKSQLGMMVWESVRALDYLLTRPEVDPNKIAMTGASGGGLNTLFTTAIEDRFACAIPVAFPCTFYAAMHAERDLNWEDGTDVCNQVPQVMSYAEMSDIASLFIPKPYLIISGKQDKIFPIAGVRQVSTEIAHNYQLAGVPERFRLLECNEEHGYQQSLRQAACGWLNQWLFHQGDGAPIPEPPLDLLPDPFPLEYSTPPLPTPGHLQNQSPRTTPLPGALPGFCLPPRQAVRENSPFAKNIQKTADTLPGYPPIPVAAVDLPAWQEQMKGRIRDILGPFPHKRDLETRLYNQVWEEGLMAERVTFTSEPGITIPGLFIMPAEWHYPSPFVIYVGEWGKSQGLQSGLIEQLVRSGYGVLAVDVRGVGETAASDFEAATDCLMLDRPLFGQRVFDVIRAADFLWERGYIAPQIDKGRLVIVGEGLGGLWGLYAAALDGRVAAVVARHSLYSYMTLLNQVDRLTASVYLFDVLNHFDLPQVIASCAPRPVYLRPVDGLRRLCSAAGVEQALLPAKEAFSLAGNGGDSFQVDVSKKGHRIPKWLDEALSR